MDKGLRQLKNVGYNYPFPNLNGCTVDILERISNSIPDFMMDVITYPCCEYRYKPANVRVKYQRNHTICTMKYQGSPVSVKVK